MKHCKIFLTDEGYGHIVRQQAVMEELQKLDKGIDFTIQTKEHFEAAKRIIKNGHFIKKYNNISWIKRQDGSPDVSEIKSKYKKYISSSKKFIKEELKNDYDFVLSDYVYEAFEYAHQKKIPSFGIAHFTWDWFFSKLYPPPIELKVLDYFLACSAKAKKIYFPPLTPEEILKFHKSKAVQVPFIVKSGRPVKKILSNKKFKILFIDSGSGLLTPYFKKVVPKLNKIKEIQFYISSNFKTEYDNVTLIDKNELLADYINEVDLVIGRAGFNTISECIAYRTPMLLFSESMNPEMNENIINLKKLGLGSFISLDRLLNDFEPFLSKFISHEYKHILNEMKNHNLRIDGAKVIAKDILNSI